MDKAKAINDVLKREIEAYKEVQRDMSKNVQAKQQFIQQQNECEMVMKELELMEDGADVFKLVGPVLVKQDLLEARSNVAKRLEFIAVELKRLEGVSSSYQEKKAKREGEIMRLQSELQKVQASS